MKRFIALLLCVFGSLAASLRADVELSLDFYYDQLSPYGEWAEVEGYGQVWHPSGVDDDWAPYADGYWTYTDAGWTWVSYEDWGGICYHYGRWTRIADYGWCWVPGYEWGPAWVSWRKSEDYVGWAPLPPECDWEEERGVGVWVDVNYDIGPRYYNFCRIRDFGAPVIRHVLFPRIRNVDICFSTVNITNISYNRGYGVVYNGGFDYDYIRTRCERPIPTLKLVQNTTNIFINNNGGNVFVNAPRGNALVVAAPRVATNYRQFTRKPAALRTFRRDAVTRGWAGVDQQETRARLVSKMREETKGLSPTNAPARPVRQEALAVVPKTVDLDARPTGLRRQTAERPSRTAAAAVQVPVDKEAITAPSRKDRIEKMRPGSRGETAETPTSTDRPAVTEPRGRGSDAPIAGKDEGQGGLRKRPGRMEGDDNQPATNVPSRGNAPVAEDRGRETERPARTQGPRDLERPARVTEQEAPKVERPERGGEMRRPNEDRPVRQAQEDAKERATQQENAERQLKQREQAEAGQNAAERAQRQRAAEMQRDAQENANRAARENAARENVDNARRAQEMRNAENAAKADRQRQAADQAEAAQRQAAQRAAADRQLENQRRQSMERQADAQRERAAAAQQNEARQRQMEAARERANDAQRERAMEVQRERAAAQQNEARQRQAEANRERAMENQQRAAAAAQAQQRAAAQAQAQQLAAAQAENQQRAAAQAQAQQQRAAAEANARRQAESRGQGQGGEEDPRKKRNR